MTKKLLVIFLFNVLLAAGLGALIYYAVRRSSESAGQPAAYRPATREQERYEVLRRLEVLHGK